VVKIDHKACIAYGPACEEACVAKCPRQIFRHYAGRQVLSRAKVDGLKMAG
jgi:electron transport complex protein RnfB